MSTSFVFYFGLRVRLFVFWSVLSGQVESRKISYSTDQMLFFNVPDDSTFLCQTSLSSS